MFKTLLNVFRVPELRNKVLFTLFMLLVYRVGFHIPIPGVNQSALEAKMQEGAGTTAVERFANYASLFSGGNLSQSTIFGLGIMPYISASIILQLLTTVVPALEKLKKEGQTGQRKIQEWTRYLTVPLCVVQAIFWLGYMHQNDMVQAGFQGSSLFWIMGIFSLTAGCIFLMWLGEQIDEYGLGNGISLIIMAGILSRMPYAIILVIETSNFSLSGAADPQRTMTLGKLIFLLASFVSITAGSILITQAQRRIPIQQAKHTRGRKVYGGAKQYLPLRVNHGGVMPIIFAQSLMLFPGFLFSTLAGDPNQVDVGWWTQSMRWLNLEFTRGGYVYIITEIAMIYFFAYFWTTVQFQPKEMASQLRDYGSFIPGLRPGKRTADYLERVMMRITFVGAAFLAIIAVIPTAVSAWLDIDWQITAFLGGTGLLIVVSVGLDMVQRIEANLLMRNYSGFLSSPGAKGKRIKGSQY
ncbi:MAG: preprotein translocase subunit SecY [Phycisphaerales bacterium]|nr:preprotein translocase subunit SecY [Phycisphaerales bacterium]